MIDSSDSSPTTTTIPVTLKWNKQVYTLAIQTGEISIAFKQRVEALTGVPVPRQKLLATKGGWKGPLKDDTILDASTIKSTNNNNILTVTLIGSAETLAGPTQKTTFVEDLSREELQAAQDAEAQAAMATAEGMIPALQLPPHLRDDHKQELYQYNRLVSGLPQRQIEQELKYGQGATTNRELQGKVAMTLGLELRRAYVNDLAVLQDGTCVSAMDDGHVQLWKHGAQQEDVVHVPSAGEEGGVDNVVALRLNPTRAMAFATAGRGAIHLWSSNGDAIIGIRNSIPGTTPASLTCIYGGATTEHVCDEDNTITCLANRFRVTRQVDPSQFRLPPQNDVERQRRAQAEAQERAIQGALDKAARSVQLWYLIEGQLKSKILEPPIMDPDGSAHITSLACLSFPDGRVLAVGDVDGGIRLWRVRRTSADYNLEFQHFALFQLKSEGTSCSIVGLKTLTGGRLAVSTDIGSNTGVEFLSGATLIPVTTPRAVHILDFSGLFSGTNVIPTLQSTLTGHTKDAVITMCQLPNGDLLTGGGKMDATLQLWSASQLLDAEGSTGSPIQSAPRKVLSEVGYVFALVVLPDTKKDSNYFAVAAARYNSVKIII